MSFKQNKTGAFLAGLTFPISSFVYALWHPDSKSFKLLFVMYFTFIGMAYCMGTLEHADIYRYSVVFYQASLLKDVGFRDYFNSLAEANQVDYYSSFMVWFVSRFTSDYRIYFGILAMIMALFFAANVEYVIKQIDHSRINILLIVVLAMIPSASLYIHRWWMAMQVFLFGLLPVLIEKKYFRLIWCFFAAFLVHFSFVYPLILVIIALLLPKTNLWIYYVLFLVSVFLESFNFDIVTPLFGSFLSEAVVNRTNSHLSAELLEHNFFSQSSRLVMKIANAIICFWILAKHGKYLYKNRVLRVLFVMSLLLGSFANLTSLTEWGWRYYDLSNMMFVVLYLEYMSDENCNAVIFKYVSPLYIYFILFQIYGLLNVIGPNQLLFGNWFTTWIINDIDTVWGLTKSI